jgi:predicted nucleic acid-binding protein
MKLFVDTGAWYALYNDVDDYHHQASAFLQELVGRRSWLFTSDYGFDETVTLLRARLGHRKAVFVLMRQLKLTDAFALHHHFEQMSFVMWPRTG